VRGREQNNLLVDFVEEKKGRFPCLLLVLIVVE